MLSRGSPVRVLGRGLAILLISGLAGATLVRLAPGFGVDERALDPRMSAQSLQAIERQYARDGNPLAFYIRFLTGLIRGDAGQSVVFGEPVGRLIGERLPTTIHEVAAGLGIGWMAALAFATAGALSRAPPAVLAGMAVSGALLSIPSAVLATLCLLLRLSPAFAIAAVVFPRVFPHAYEQLRASLGAPHVVMARARGVPGARLFLFHVVPPALMPLIALAGVSVTLAFGASIPIEALADAPGLGQLAWRAALGRDLPVLVSITLLLTLLTVVANMAADLVLERLAGPAA
jgi:peptide/nickel transport system permease protein